LLSSSSQQWIFLCIHARMLTSWWLSQFLTATDWLVPLILVTYESKSLYDRRSVSQSVHHGVEPHLGLTTRYLLLFDIYCFVGVGRPLWREVGSVICINHLNCFSSVILLLAFASYLNSSLGLNNHCYILSRSPRYITSEQTAQKTPLPGIPLLLNDVLSRLLPSDGLGIVDVGAVLLVAMEIMFTSHCIGVDVFSGSAVPAFSCHVTVSSQSVSQNLFVMISYHVHLS
jgi:hypothetical protein